MANVISWFEIPAADFQRAVTFYSDILEVSLEESEVYGFPMAFFPNEGDGVTGAIVYTKDYEPHPKGTIVYLNAKNKLSDILEKVEASGGKIEIPKTSLGYDGGFGFMAVITDTEGNRIGLHSEN